MTTKTKRTQLPMLRVNGWPPEADLAPLRALLRSHGDLIRLQRYDWRRKNMVTARFADMASAREALASVDGMRCAGHRIRLRFA